MPVCFGLNYLCNYVVYINVAMKYNWEQASNCRIPHTEIFLCTHLYSLGPEFFSLHESNSIILCLARLYKVFREKIPKVLASYKEKRDRERYRNCRSFLCYLLILNFRKKKEKRKKTERERKHLGPG